MYIEKNMFDNIFNKVMDIKGKTKDNVNVSRDLKIICNLPELELDERRSNIMPKAVYTLGKEQKRKVCEWIRGLKFPDGYAFNLACCFDMMELRMHSMKSHDCDVFMQKLISIAFCEMLPEHGWCALADGPNAEVTSFLAYFVNSYNFQTEHYNTGKSTMNCRVCVKSSSYTDKENDFYGIIEEIIQLTYPLIPNFHIALFKCLWVNPVQGMKVHPRYYLIDVNFKKLYQKDDPFILAQQVVQVYFTEYPSMKRDKADWMAVCKTKARRVVDDSKWTETVTLYQFL
ncbi:UNVERIFIED_CONTAM: hypothetical protein Sradi_0701100 [Sesamum radiatum]|uniref:DUF4216 domain-containing protein n=1 Tax=Sesamum radiatum TaxID=300843 RepID=A0AAW2VSF3_SESRA